VRWRSLALDVLSSLTTAQPSFKASRNEVGKVETALSVCMKILQAFRVPRRRRGKTQKCAGHARRAKTNPALRVSELFDDERDGASRLGPADDAFDVFQALAEIDLVGQTRRAILPRNVPSERLFEFGGVIAFLNGAS
jgi:hypothetical protein